MWYLNYFIKQQYRLSIFLKLVYMKGKMMVLVAIFVTRTQVFGHSNISAVPALRPVRKVFLQ